MATKATIDYTLKKGESASAYNKRIALARGDSAKELKSMQKKSKNVNVSQETPTQTVARAQSVLDQTQAQGDTPYKGSAFDKNFIAENPTVPSEPVMTPDVPKPDVPTTDTVTSTVDNPNGTTPNNLASGGTDTGTMIQNPDGTSTFNPQSSTQSQNGATPLTNPSVVDYLNSTGQPSDFSSRKNLASALGIADYTGTVAQNQQLISHLRGIPVSPVENITPTSPGAITQTSNNAPVATKTSFDHVANTFGLSQTEGDFMSDPIKTIKDITKQVFSAMGIDQADKQIKDVAKELEKMENSKDDEIRAVNDNPWLTEGVRLKQIDNIKNKWEGKINNRTNTLNLLENVKKDATQQAQFALGTAISIFDSERKFQASQVQAYYDQAQHEFDNAIKLHELENKQTGTSEMQEYTFSVKQGFKGSFLDYKKAISAAGRASGSDGGLTPAQINTTVNGIASAYDNEQTVRDYNTIRRNVDVFDNLGNTATDDIQRVYTFAKVADPNSAVKEGEYASIEKYAQAVMQRAGLRVSRVFNPTGILTQEARTAMSQTLNTSLSASERAKSQVQAEYQRQIDDAYSGKPRTITQYTPPTQYGPNQNSSQASPYASETQGVTFGNQESLAHAIFGFLFD